MQRKFGDEAREALYKSVFLLVAEQGRVEERLALAYFQHIRPIDGTTLPADAQARLEEIRAALKRMFPEPGKLDSVDQNEAVNLAMAIILLYDDLSP